MKPNTPLFFPCTSGLRQMITSKKLLNSTLCCHFFKSNTAIVDNTIDIMHIYDTFFRDNKTNISQTRHYACSIVIALKTLILF